jgi:hypothetical protein
VITADTITDEQIRELRGLPNEASARALRNAAETRAGRKFNDARDKAFAFFGSSDVEQAARSNAIQRAESARAASVEKAIAMYRARCAEILNARTGASK